MAYSPDGDHTMEGGEGALRTRSADAYMYIYMYRHPLTAQHMYRCGLSGSTSVNHRLLQNTHEKTM